MTADQAALKLLQLVFKPSTYHSAQLAALRRCGMTWAKKVVKLKLQP